MFEGLGKVAAYGGKNMKNNKIRIYQCFLSLRIFFIFAATCLFIDIIMNIKNILVDAKIWELFLYLIFYGVPGASPVKPVGASTVF